MRPDTRGCAADFSRALYLRTFWLLRLPEGSRQPERESAGWNRLGDKGLYFSAASPGHIMAIHSFAPLRRCSNRRVRSSRLSFAGSWAPAAAARWMQEKRLLVQVDQTGRARGGRSATCWLRANSPFSTVGGMHGSGAAVTGLVCQQCTMRRCPRPWRWQNGFLP